MAGQTSPVGLNESLAEAKTLWIGDLAYWCDETWLTSLFVGARHSPRAPIALRQEAPWAACFCFCGPACCCNTPGGRPGPPVGPQDCDVRLCAPAGTGALESVKVIRDKATRCWPGPALPLAAHALLACVVSGACSLFTKQCVAADLRRWCSWWGSASAGYGFITFSSHTVAESVLGAYNGVPIPNTDLVFRLNWAAFGVGKITSEGAPRRAWSKAPGAL